jgi:hypothetical protein
MNEVNYPYPKFVKLNGTRLELIETTKGLRYSTPNQSIVIRFKAVDGDLYSLSINPNYNEIKLIPIEG